VAHAFLPFLPSFHTFLPRVFTRTRSLDEKRRARKTTVECCYALWCVRDVCTVSLYIYITSSFFLSLSRIYRILGRLKAFLSVQLQKRQRVQLDASTVIRQLGAQFAHRDARVFLQIVQLFFQLQVLQLYVVALLAEEVVLRFQREERFVGFFRRGCRRGR